jgi:hypothetical protein
MFALSKNTKFTVLQKFLHHNIPRYMRIFVFFGGFFKEKFPGVPATPLKFIASDSSSNYTVIMPNIPYANGTLKCTYGLSSEKWKFQNAFRVRSLARNPLGTPPHGDAHCIGKCVNMFPTEGFNMIPFRVKKFWSKKWRKNAKKIVCPDFGAP